MEDRYSMRSKRSRLAVDNLVDYSVGGPVDHPVDNPDPTPTFTNVSAAHEKVAQIAALLKEWHWSFGTLVKHWLTYKDGQQGMRSARKKTDLLRVLLTEDAETTYKELKNHNLLVESMELATAFVVNGIRDELAALRDSSTVFGRWDPRLDFERLDLSKAVIELRSDAPVFTHLITELAKNQRGVDDACRRKENTGYTVIIASILLLKFSRNSTNSFARMLGLYLQGSGIKRRAISVLHGLGVIESYWALDQSKKPLSDRSENAIKNLARHDDVAVFYDNFNYYQRARHQIIGDPGTMYNYTTAKLIRAGDSRIPAGGLRQDMIRGDIELDSDDILRSDDYKYDKTWEEIQRFIIVRAIKSVYSQSVKKIYSNSSEPTMPIVDILPPARTEHLTMDAIPEDESSVLGNYKVIDNIFKQQMGLEEQLNEYGNQQLFLIYGDQKTCGLIRSCKRQRCFQTSSTYHQLKWALPAPGLWHLRLNYLQMVLSSFYGGRKYSDQLSTLYPQINALNRHNIPKRMAPFHHMEELILHSLDARIIGVLYTQIGEKCDPRSSDSVSSFLSGLSTIEFQSVVDAIFQELFAREVREKYSNICHDAADNDSIPQLDMELVNHIRFIQAIEPYVVLKHAIKHADIGLLRKAIVQCCVIFHGTSSKNYARELLHLCRLTATKAADPVLQRAILGCGLVNLRGKADSFFEADRMVELLNLQLKELMWSRGNSTFDVEQLFKWGLSTSNYYLPLRGAFELSFGEWTNSEHTPKSASSDIHSLAHLLFQDSIIRRKYRHVGFSAPEFTYTGFQRLLDGSIVRAFNAEVKQVGVAGPEMEDNDHQFEDDTIIGYQATDEIVSAFFQYC